MAYFLLSHWPVVSGDQWGLTRDNWGMASCNQLLQVVSLTITRGATCDHCYFVTHSHATEGQQRENNHWVSDPEQRRNFVCNYLRQGWLYLAAMVLLALRRMLSPWTGWNSRGWAGGQWPPALWLRPIRALIFLSTFITVCSVWRSASNWGGPGLCIRCGEQTQHTQHTPLSAPAPCYCYTITGGRDALPCSCPHHRVSTTWPGSLECPERKKEKKLTIQGPKDYCVNGTQRGNWKSSCLFYFLPDCHFSRPPCAGCYCCVRAAGARCHLLSGDTGAQECLLQEQLSGVTWSYKVTSAQCSRGPDAWTTNLIIYTTVAQAIIREPGQRIPSIPAIQAATCWWKEGPLSHYFYGCITSSDKTVDQCRGLRSTSGLKLLQIGDLVTCSDREIS